MIGKPSDSYHNIETTASWQITAQGFQRPATIDELRYDDSPENSTDIFGDDQLPMITDELTPSLKNRVFRVIKTFVLFPTRTRIICSIITFFWLIYCCSMITYGLTNEHYCPASPHLSHAVALHGVFWTITSGYAIIRLIWSEVSPLGQPSFKCRFGGPRVILDWKKEYTYGVDGFVGLLLLTSYINSMLAFWRLLVRKPHLVAYNHKNWLTVCEDKYSDNCCRKFLFDYALSLQVISYIAIFILLISYLYIIGAVNYVRSRVCYKSYSTNRNEQSPLVPSI